ncbi:MAG: (Fe-S)-binding protein, partial [Bdellovibrionota bacterium]
MYLLLQGFRLAFDVNAPDRPYAFVGNLFGFLFPKNMSTDSANTVYGSIWYVHMLTTMAFIATVPYTRALHIVTASLNLITARLEPTVLLAKMNFENAEAEYFGAREVQDFTWKDLLSFDSCTECRRCTDICPANAVGKPLDPREVILKLRDSMLVEAQFAKSSETIDV